MASKIVCNGSNNNQRRHHHDFNSSITFELDTTTTCRQGDALLQCYPVSSDARFSFLDLEILHIPDTLKTNKQACSSALLDSLINYWCQGAYARTGPRPQLTISSKLSTRPQSLPTSHTTADVGQPSRAMTSSHVYEMHGPLTRPVGHVIASPLSPFPFEFLLHSVKRPRQTETDPELELWPPRSRSRLRIRFRLDMPPVCPLCESCIRHALVSVSCVYLLFKILLDGFFTHVSLCLPRCCCWRWRCDYRLLHSHTVRTVGDQAMKLAPSSPPRLILLA